VADRTNQKQRTRQALVDAARALAANGRTVSIADVAEAAQVSVATAYRYFSNPNDLVLEAAVGLGPLSKITADLPNNPADRIDEVVRRLAEFQFGDEGLWRAMLRANMERWAQQAVSDPEARVPIRSRARLEMVQQALAPLAEKLPPQVQRRLIMATMLVCGMEALVAARDACGLEPDEATEVMRWAAQALLQVALSDSTSPSTPPTGVSRS
jgi:AcrR family transcriptional regulator